jgi:hypothetical protein
MPSPQLHFIWVSENGFQTGCCVPSQVQCPACCLCCSPCMSATYAKTVWSLTSCLPITLRVIIRFLWANAVMRATESGISYSSFLWSTAQWSFWKWRVRVKGTDPFQSLHLSSAFTNQKLSHVLFQHLTLKIPFFTQACLILHNAIDVQHVVYSDTSANEWPR